MLLGVDLGTGSVKTLLLSEDGVARSEASVSYTVRAPRPGRAESDPEEWWDAVTEAARTAVESADSHGAEVRALGLSGQMHGVVLSGGDGRPLWADGRSKDQLAAYRGLDGAASPPAASIGRPRRAPSRPRPSPKGPSTPATRAGLRRGVRPLSGTVPAAARIIRIGAIEPGPVSRMVENVRGAARRPEAPCYTMFSSRGGYTEGAPPS